MAGKEILYKMWISTCTFSWTHHCFSQSTHPQGWHGQYCSGLQATHIMNVCSECSASNHGSANMRDQNTQAWMPMNIAVTVLDVQPKLQYIVPQNPPQQSQHEVSIRHSCNHDWRGTSWQWSQWEVQVDFATIWWSQVKEQAVALTCMRAALILLVRPRGTPHIHNASPHPFNSEPQWGKPSY